MELKDNTAVNEGVEFSGDLLRAILFAAHKHRSQKRKDVVQSPYINHPLQVAEILWFTGSVRIPEVLLSAVLHDTLEDTDATEEELIREFGERVTAIIKEVTDDKQLPKQTRKLLQIEHAPHLTKEAKLVKLADKICNIRDVINNPPAEWAISRRIEYLKWAKAVVDGLRGVHSGLEAVFDKYHATGMNQLNGQSVQG